MKNNKNKKNPFDEILARMEAAEKAEQERYEKMSAKFVDEAELITEEVRANFADLEDVLDEITAHIEDSNLEALGAQTDVIKDYIDESEIRTVNAIRKDGKKTRELIKSKFEFPWFSFVMSTIFGIIMGFVAHIMLASAAAGGCDRLINEAGNPSTFAVWGWTLVIGFGAFVMFFMIASLLETSSKK